MLRCDRCGWECEPGTPASKVGTATYQQGSVHVCQMYERYEFSGYGYMREIEPASGTPSTETDDGD